MPLVDGELLTAEFWLKRLGDPDEVLMSDEDIRVFNAAVYGKVGIPNVFELDDEVSDEFVREMIRQYGIPETPRYDSMGQLLEKAFYEAMLINAAPELPSRVAVRFGLATRRTSVRTFPSWDLGSKEPMDFGFDEFQETTIDVGWEVAVFATSRNEAWYFCLTPLYWGWVPVEDIALGVREAVESYVTSNEFIMTVASRGLVGLATGNGITPQMGTRLPLMEAGSQFCSVKVPIGQEELGFVEGIIRKPERRGEQFWMGNLPYAVRTLFEQAFSMLHEPYAWGGGRLGIFGRDCSRVIKDVFGTTGIVLPRNVGQQRAACEERVVFSPEMGEDERKGLIVEYARPGDIFISAGHEALYLGHLDGEPYCIHSVGGAYLRVVVSDLNFTAENPIWEKLKCVVGIPIA